MTLFDWIRLIIILAVLVSLLMSVFCVYFAAYMVYTHTLVRRPGKTWGRQISENNPDLHLMWNAGILWAQQNEEFKKELSIQSKDGLKLVAEFYDFGFDKTVIIMPGRRECLIYSYYYAYPYKDIGINVLVIDQRAHGLSEGKYATAGILEAEDVILWSKHLNTVHKQNTVFLHGICVGTCCSVNVVRHKDCPSFIKAVVLDSTPLDYKEIFGNHMMEQGHKLWPTFPRIWWWFKKHTGQDINESSPSKFITKVNLPICFIHGTNDKYSIPEKSYTVYERCPSKQKEWHYIENAGHSKVRYCNPPKYDQIIADFFNKQK